MTNQEKLQNYLLGYGKKEGYLKGKSSNGKVIMLSGKWGSGKTHFWQNKIVPNLTKEENTIPNHYISLYGKTSIDEIKNEIFIKVFESVDSFESTEKTLDITKKSAKLVSMFSSTINVLGMSLDLSKATDKTFNGLENLLENKKLKKTEEYLDSGAVICFDDFERKSKEIDLNDLFGFITQLTLNFDCKVVIILNDDVFEGEEKRIFTNVKEKTVSKFLYYNPTIDELFKLIFESNKEYKKLNEYKDKILEIIKETEELNARIYIQILHNLIDCKDKKNYFKCKTLRYLILTNIYFSKHHIVYRFNKSSKLFPNLPIGFQKLNGLSGKLLQTLDLNIPNFSKAKDKYSFLDILKEVLLSSYKYKQKPDKEYEVIPTDKLLDDLMGIEKHEEYLWIFWKLDIILEYRKDIDEKIINEINDFIETGVLIDE